MANGKVRVAIPIKSIKSKNKLDVVSKRNIMYIFNRLNRDKIAQENRDMVVIRCLCYLLKLNKESSDESALLFKKFSSWFFTNLVALNKLDNRYTSLFTLYIEKLSEIKDKYDNDLRHECYFYDVVDDIFEAIKDIVVIKKVLGGMVVKSKTEK